MAPYSSRVRVVKLNAGTWKGFVNVCPLSCAIGSYTSQWSSGFDLCFTFLLLRPGQADTFCLLTQLDTEPQESQASRTCSTFYQQDKTSSIGGDVNKQTLACLLCGSCSKTSSGTAPGLSTDPEDTTALYPSSHVNSKYHKCWKRPGSGSQLAREKTIFQHRR